MTTTVVPKEAPTAPPAVPAFDGRAAFKLIRSVVQIRNSEGGGSGVILRSVQAADGSWRTYILTAAHVTMGQKRLEVIDFWRESDSHVTGRTVYPRAKVVDISREIDVALIEVRSDADLGRRSELVTDASDLAPGEPVHAIGCPNLERPSMTDGRIADLEPPGLRISTPISPGDSGGAVFLEDGRLLGIVTGCKVTEGPFGPAPVWHMAVGTPGPVIALWLRCVGAGFLVGDAGSTPESLWARHPAKVR